MADPHLSGPSLQFFKADLLSFQRILFAVYLQAAGSGHRRPSGRRLHLWKLTPITPAESTKTEPPITGMLIQSDEGGSDDSETRRVCPGSRLRCT